MYVEHLRKDFYDVLTQGRVLILSSYDVDSVATCKIFMNMFTVDQISHTVVAVDGVSELRNSYLEYRGSFKVILLINCGGTIDVMELFENPAETTIFILDSHRPTHILNIYDESKQVFLVSPPMDDEGVPSIDDIYRADDESESESSDDEDEGVPPENDDEDGMDVDDNGTVSRKRSRTERHYHRIVKARERKVWEDRRRRILYEYTQHSCYGVPTSLIALEVAWTMSRSNCDLVWYAILGLTEFFVLRRIERANYTLLVTEIQSHVQRLKHNNSSMENSLSITFENDLYLFLYRRWSMWESFKYTPTFSTALALWSQRGEQTLKSYMLDSGLPLREVRQVFPEMAYDLILSIKERLERKADKYKISDDLFFGTFFVRRGWTYKFAALDMYLATLALMDQPHVKRGQNRFLNAMNCMTRDRPEIKSGIENARLMITTIYKQVQGFMEMKMFMVTSPLIYVIAREGGLETDWFGRPGCLVILAQFSLRTFVESSNRKSVRHLPLVLMAPKNQDRDHFLAVGIPPVTASVTQNLFGRAFEQVSLKMPDAVVMDCFETSICQVKATHKDKFLELLISILTE